MNLKETSKKDYSTILKVLEIDPHFQMLFSILLRKTFFGGEVFY